MNRVLIDTNVLVAALLFPGGTPAQAFWHVANEEHLILTDWVIDEIRDVVMRKWPDRLTALDTFLATVSYDILPVGSAGIVIRDAKDQPIPDAAIAGGVDVILTGDKDFHALLLSKPRVLRPRDYLDLIG